MKKLTSTLIDLYKSIHKAKSFFATNLWHRKSLDSWLKPSEHIELLGHREATQLFLHSLSLVQQTIACSKIGIPASSALQCSFLELPRCGKWGNNGFNGEHHQGSGMGRSEVSFNSRNKNLLSGARKMSLTVAFLALPIAWPKSNAVFVL